MNRTYEEWLKYYENATKEDVIQDMMLDINSIKEKNKEIERLHNIIKEVREYIEEHTTYEKYGYIDEIQLIDLDFSIKDLKQILDKENK